MAGRGLVVQTRFAPAGVVMASVTPLVSVVMVLPPASWMVATGWVGNARLPVESLGWVVNASLAAGPVVMVIAALSAVVNAPSAAVSVYVPALSMLQAVKAETPAMAVIVFVSHASTAPAG